MQPNTSIAPHAGWCGSAMGSDVDADICRMFGVVRILILPVQFKSKDFGTAQTSALSAIYQVLLMVKKKKGTTIA